MAQCAYCQTETQLHYGDTPICVKCSEEREVKRKPPLTQNEIRRVLVDGIVKATARVSAANEGFSATMSQFPSGLPHPDGVQRIKNASHELSAARKEMMRAHQRLNEFIDTGVVPDDLKQTG